MIKFNIDFQLYDKHFPIFSVGDQTKKNNIFCEFFFPKTPNNSKYQFQSIQSWLD